MPAAIANRLGTHWSADSDAVSYHDRIEMDGQVIALRPPGLQDHEWRAVCFKLCGHAYRPEYPVSTMPVGWDNLADVRRDQAMPGRAYSSGRKR